VSDTPSTSPIGRRRPRPATRRALEGRGRYVDDFSLPRMLHAAFLRSPYARARILAIDTGAAKSVAGVARVVTGADLEKICAGWRGNSGVLPGLNSPLQRALAVAQVAYQGEPVAAVLADSRAAAEDGVEQIHVEWQEETPTRSLAEAQTAPPAHPELANNTGFHMAIGTPENFAQAEREAAFVIEETLSFARHTAVPLESRGLIADFNPADGTLTVHHSHQTPNEMQALFGELLGIEQHLIRIVTPDIGGGFGMKLHLYPDEVATVAMSKLAGRPVKFIADRLESFQADTHAREHLITARIAVSATGRILGFEVRDICGMGAYSVRLRTSVSEALMAIRVIGAPYDFAQYHGSVDAVFQNRPMTGAYRAVGYPIGCAVTEHLVDRAARRLSRDPAQFRRDNFMPKDGVAYKTPTGAQLAELSHRACLEKILPLIGWDALARERDRLRASGVYRGIGIAAFVEQAAPNSELNGAGGMPVIAMESATLKLEPSGTVRCMVGTTEMGQGTTATYAQIAAAAIGVPVESVGNLGGDTGMMAAGGGSWGSRGTAIGGEAVLQAGKRLRAEILGAAGRLLQSDPEALDVVEGSIILRETGAARLTLKELAEIAYFRGHLLPPGPTPQFVITQQYRRPRDPLIATNGVQASHLELDIDTGIVRLLKHWVVEDCGRIINPLLVDEQIRGGVAQGIGAALFEACRYDTRGQLLSGSLADYLVPMAGEMPDIVIGHVETLYSGSELGSKGAGEAGTCAAGAAVLNAVNDALSPFGAVMRELPITPAAVLAALAEARR
jgi:aerobic carbon-monoxide dehydrogenase large subunit